ncbi:Protein of unknown function [Pyronema omphalodes CBS 100304]|uniref:Uncharacterized protein n=1 Tax=Pyronema omphalodes (strain CBS 100304) TaxID=1076935 RepID=U4L295_PYROM|nr:Protein of unknown function [Pyronema omphalodes CBS 100304]
MGFASFWSPLVLWMSFAYGTTATTRPKKT